MKMCKFIELRFGQAFDDMVQREIVPVDAIKNVFVELPEKRNIQITFENDGRSFTRREFYKNELECTARYTDIKRILCADLGYRYYTPLPDDAEDCKEYIRAVEETNRIINEELKKK